MLKRLVVCFLLAAVALPPAAAAHVTLNPREWEAGGFARFAVRVPNERPDADTTEVTVQFPENVITASFQPVPGWTRTVEMATLDQPVEIFGEQVTERIASVTWTGGTIAPGEFQEFGISFQVPETPGEELVFPSLQTYSSGEVVRWIGSEDADTPAPIVAVLAPEEAEGGGVVGATTTEETSSGEAAPEPTASEDDGDSKANLALILGIAGLVAGLVALAFTLLWRPRRV
ncbi:MAG: YcnI family protein [Gaiellaceae bacterium]